MGDFSRIVDPVRCKPEEIVNLVRKCRSAGWLLDEAEVMAVHAACRPVRRLLEGGPVP
jgi:hypothetical protein